MLCVSTLLWLIQRLDMMCKPGYSAPLWILMKVRDSSIPSFNYFTTCSGHYPVVAGLFFIFLIDQHLMSTSSNSSIAGRPLILQKHKHNVQEAGNYICIFYVSVVVAAK